MGKKIIIKKPFDMHVHFRSGNILKCTVNASYKQFSKAVVMPNTIPPIITMDDAKKYRNKICSYTSDFKFECFEPLMAAYLTNNTNVDDLIEGYEKKILFCAKLYPFGATTNSNFGVKKLKDVYDIFKVMEEISMPLCVHGEVTDDKIDIFDREDVFYKDILSDILDKFPNLKITMEHITTKKSVDFLKSAGDNIAATVTPQHLMYDRNDMLVGGIRPHLYCLPILKKSDDKIALRELVCSGFERVFLGTDSAPHSIDNKECVCGCAGVYSAENALEFYVNVFDEENSLENFEKFSSINAAKFHKLKLSDENITLKKEKNKVVDRETIYGKYGIRIKPLMDGEEINWKFYHE